MQLRRPDVQRRLLRGSPARGRVERKLSDNEKQGEECASHLVVPRTAAPEIRALTIVSVRDAEIGRGYGFGAAAGVTIR